MWVSLRHLFRSRPKTLRHSAYSPQLANNLPNIFPVNEQHFRFRWICAAPNFKSSRGKHWDESGHRNLPILFFFCSRVFSLNREYTDVPALNNLIWRAGSKYRQPQSMSGGRLGQWQKPDSDHCAVSSRGVCRWIFGWIRARAEDEKTVAST